MARRVAAQRRGLLARRRGEVIPDFLDLMEALLAVNARFLVVGATPWVSTTTRATKDLADMEALEKPTPPAR